MPNAIAILYHVLSAIIQVIPQRTRFWLWCCLIRRSNERWGQESKAQRLYGGTYITMSVLIRLTEGRVIEFVRNHTNVPVPVVIDNFAIDGATVLVLSRPSRGVLVRDLPHTVAHSAVDAER